MMIQVWSLEIANCKSEIENGYPDVTVLQSRTVPSPSSHWLRLKG
jgi:hypothetical protein